jgi:general secretion pathway protein F
MPTFDYVAIDAGGQQRSGRVAAADEGTARASLERRRLLPVRLVPYTGAATDAADGRARKLSGKALTLFTRQLATLIAVSPLEEALRAIGQQADKRNVSFIVGRVHAGVVEGRRLADAMALEPRSFPPLYRAMVAAGETSGGMTEILERLADLQERQAQVRGKLLAAIAYPAMLTLVAVLIIVGLMTYVIPKVVEQFQQIGQDLPLLTRIVIGISDVLANYGLVLLALIVLASVILARLMKGEAFRLRFDAWLLRLPLVGRLLRDLNAARLARTLATIIDNGMPLLNGLQVTARTVNNRVLRAATLDMVDAIREGGSLSASMRRSGIFPPLLVHMTASGEQGGRLSVMLARAADYLEREFDAFTAAAISLLEPAIIVIMGGVIATIVLSILLPILQLNTIALS